ncbi:MAG: YceH family protein [Solirubrobacteraceae bacterium]
MIEPDAAELRVLGALIEKQRTTPDVYPLSLNSLRLACNQSTGRDPVVDYDEDTVRDAVARLVRRGWARLASGPGSRATKYRHLLDEALSLDGAEISVLAILMLRGAQTPGELRQRTERLHGFATLAQLDALLEALSDRQMVVRFDRRPGQKEARWSLGGEFGGSATALALSEEPPLTPPAPSSPERPDAPAGDLASRIAALERDLAALRTLVAQLRAQAN